MTSQDHIDALKNHLKSVEATLLFKRASACTPLMDELLKSCLLEGQPEPEQEVMFAEALISGFTMTGMTVLSTVVQKNDKHLTSEEAMYAMYMAFTQGLVFHCFANGLDYGKLMGSVVDRMRRASAAA